MHGRRQVEITYINPAIPSMFCAPAFEWCGDNPHQTIVNFDNLTSLPNNVDFTGLRVDLCYELTSTTDVIINCLSKFLTNYHLGNNTRKSWTKQPLQFQSQLRKIIAKKLSTLKHKSLTFTHCRKFQERVVNMVDSQ